LRYCATPGHPQDLCNAKGKGCNRAIIIISLQADGARFLKLDLAIEKWFDAGFKEARLKISHAFRDACIPNKVKCIEELNASQHAQAAMQPVSCERVSNTIDAKLISCPSPLQATSFARYVSYESSDVSSACSQPTDDFADDIVSVSSAYSSVPQEFQVSFYLDMESMSPPCQTSLRRKRIVIAHVHLDSRSRSSMLLESATR
jgi:hypothetical protein